MARLKRDTIIKRYMKFCTEPDSLARSFCEELLKLRKRLRERENHISAKELAKIYK